MASLDVVYEVLPDKSNYTSLEWESARGSSQQESRKTKTGPTGVPETKEEKLFQEARSGQAHQTWLRHWD